MCVEKTPWEQVIDFHGHTCPEIAIGYRIAQIANRELGIKPAPDSELHVSAETQSCALDAFQVLNKATIGRGTLHIREQGKHVYYFHYSRTSNMLRIAVKGSVLQHITPTQTFTSPRQRQNWALENIQFVLGSSEEEFCTLQKVEGKLERLSVPTDWVACSLCHEAVSLVYTAQTSTDIKCHSCK